MKKVISLLLALMLLATAAPGLAQDDLRGVSITFLNSKGEIQSALEEVAVVFTAETGIELEIISCGVGEVPYTKVTSMYNSGTAPTLAMLDPTDIVALAELKAVDLSGEAWTELCEGSLTRIGGKVYSFPFCVEGRGLIYNKVAIDKALGENWDPNTVKTADELKALFERLRAAGMQNPIVISKEDWSLGAHLLGFVYDAHDGTTEGANALIERLTGGLDISETPLFDDLIATFDIMMEYNYNKEDPLGAIYERDPIYLADGDAAMWFNGCWVWPNLVDAGAEPSDDYGFLPLVMGDDAEAFYNNKLLAAPTKHVLIDREQASESQIAAAKAFLNWLVFSERGQRALVEDCALIPACVNNAVSSLDPLSAAIRQKIAEGNTYAAAFIAPSDHWSVVGAAMQKYLGLKSDKAELAAAINEYWAKQQ